jgi:hypothetical protein
MKPIAMRCNQHQFQEIKDILIENEVNIQEICLHLFDECGYLTNNFGNTLRYIGNIPDRNRYSHNRTVFEEWDKDIFLEYCEIKPIPEKWYMELKDLTDEELKMCNDWRKNNCTGYRDRTLYSYHTLVNCHHDGSLFYAIPLLNNIEPLMSESWAEGIKPITFEQFKKYVFKQNNMQKLTITINELLDIHYIACTEWKSAIVNYMSRMDSNQNVTFTQKEVDLMFLAATPEQLPILEKIFGKKKPDIDFDRLRTGSKVMIIKTGHHVNGIEQFDLNKPCDIVFYKTPHHIHNMQFYINGYYTSYITFHQDDNYCLFASNKEIDYITEVIEY